MIHNYLFSTMYSKINFICKYMHSIRKQWSVDNKTCHTSSKKQDMYKQGNMWLNTTVNKLLFCTDFLQLLKAKKVL